MEQQKNQIQSNIEKIINFKKEKLYSDGVNKQSWNGYTNENIKKYITSILGVLTKIHKNISSLDSIGIGNLNNLNSYIQNFVNSIQNSNIENISNEQIKSHHHDILNCFENVNTILRNSGLYNEISLSSKEINKANQDFTTVQPFLDNIIEKKPDYEKALESLESLLKKQGEVNSSILSGQANAFEERADNYKIIGWWLVGGFIFSLITGGITYQNIFNSPDTISPGKAILNIASIVVPSYLTVFCASQYLYGKKMYESYMFKFASLQTMN